MAEPSDFRTGVDVFSSDGHKLGELKGVVLRRADLSVTRVVVDIGFLRSGRKLWEGGVGLDYDRVVPIEQVQGAGEDHVTLTLSAADFKEAPAYTEDDFRAAVEFEEHRFDSPVVRQRAEEMTRQIGGEGSYTYFQEQRRGSDEMDIEEKTPVWRQEPHEKLGEVDRVLVDPTSGQAMAIVVKRGFLLHHDVVLPVRHISAILDWAIDVDITDNELAALQEFHAPPG